MNNNFMLQGLIENGNNGQMGEPKLGRKGKWGGHELELMVGTVYNESCQLLEDHNIMLALPPEPTKLTEKLSILKDMIQQLIQRSQQDEPLPQDSNIITCKDCQVYEASLQKLQGEVRQHIRYEQQLKIFQDTQQEKIEENRKEKKQLEKKNQAYRRQIDDIKGLQVNLTEKTSRLEAQVEALRKENKELRREGGTSRRESHRQSSYNDCKENRGDWAHRNVSHKKDQKGGQRRSVQKRGDSSNWRMSHNSKSHKMMSIMNQKLVHDRNAQDRRKAIHSKLEYRR